MRVLSLSAVLLVACGASQMDQDGGGAGGGTAGSAGTGATAGSAGGGLAGSGGTGGGSAGSGGGVMMPGPLGTACQVGSTCQSGFCVDGVCCNTACTDQCSACSAARTGQSAGTCSPLPNGGACRPSAGSCDVAEVCTGGVCGPDLWLDAGVLCRGSVGVCDVDERCTGASASCPADVVFDAGVSCRGSLGPCDPAESCTGMAGACPSDSLATAGTVCRANDGGCDLEEVCSGTSTVCPVDIVKDAGTVCRASAGVCDVAESCSGTSAGCPADAFVPTSSLVCLPYRCTGSAAACTTSCTATGDCAPDNRSACNGNRCERARLVFVTSLSFGSNIGLGHPDSGTGMGDAICAQLATDAGLGSNFKAWLADISSSPSTRFARDGGIYIRMNDKALVATDWADLTDGTIGATISYTEKRATASFSARPVLTGTTTNGTSATFSGGQTNTHCSFWTSTSNSFSGTVGDPLYTASSWTNAANATCGNINAVTSRLYCFEQ